MTGNGRCAMFWRQKYDGGKQMPPRSRNLSWPLQSSPPLQGQQVAPSLTSGQLDQVT